MENKFELVGKMDFRSNVDISDPCYERDGNGNIIDYPIVSGKYRCFVKNIVNSSRVAEIAIVKMGHIGVENEDYLWDYIGNIGVDAGLAGFFNHKIEYSHEMWNDFCDRLGDNNGGFDEAQYWVNFDNGFFSDSGWGDGCYDVFEYKHNGETKGLKIVFITEEEDY